MARPHGRVMFGVGTTASNAWPYERRDILMAERTRAIKRAREE